MAARQKATGWKVPLLFCGVIGILVALGALLRTPPPAPPALPEALVASARALVIDLDTPGGRPWKERIVEAASGFVPPEVKAERLGGVAAEAVAERHFDVACAAAVQVPVDARRNAAFSDIFEAAARECASLPWAVFAVHGVRDPQLARALAGRLERRWQACQPGRAPATP